MQAAHSDFMFVLSVDGTVVDFKPGSSSLFYVFPDSVIHRKIQDIFPSDFADNLEYAIQNVHQTGDALSMECSLLVADEEHWLDARIIPLPHSQAIFTARDITQVKHTEARMKRQMQQLSALRSIDLAIASGLDLNLLLSMLLDQVKELLKVDATSILLLNPKTHLLEFAAGKGFRSSSLQYTHLKMGEGCAGRVALERKMLDIPDLRQNQMGFERSPLFGIENFISYYGVPLIAKGRVLGVLEIFHRSLLKSDADWLEFLGMIAGQAAIAIDSAMMFREVQRSNIDLNMAYDATIEGLSRALDLRDRETEKHTRRVTDITVSLAVRLGVGDSDLVHIRRGAILHDIGKVAIPDKILLKPGPLADDEWKVMRRHPSIAVELLSSVEYLAPAMDIPHWHHEKWDGTGYPDQLSGDAIPFPARMFALVDVYDALTSDRPYRSAWSKQHTLQYIENQSAKHFDPKLLPEFLKLMNEIRI